MNHAPLFAHSGTLRELLPLRGRQIDVIPQIAEAVRQGHKRIIIQAPTGAGKTVMAAHIMDRSAKKGKRPIFVAPAIQLVEQTLKSFEAQGISDIGIIQANHRRTDWKAQVQIASRDTLVRRAPPEVDLILIDEVHDRRDALDELLDKWGDKIAIGFSATPWSKGLGLRWTYLIVAATMKEMIADGAPTGLSPFRVFAAQTDPDMSKVKTVAGDFQESGSALVMSTSAIIGDTVQTWLKHRQEGNHPGDRTFMFGVNRAHAKVLMEAFRAQGIPFGYMDGETPGDEREKVFQAYRRREIKGIANVGVLVTGVDEDVRSIIDAAPTKSQIVHVQRWGRGARLADGKAYCLGLDHAGNCTRLGLPEDIHHDHLDTRTPKDKGEAYADDKPAPKPRKCQQCFAVIPPKTHICPSCGYAYTPPNTVEHQQGELVEMAGVGKKEGEMLLAAMKWLESKGLNALKDYGYENAFAVARKHGYTGPMPKAKRDEKQDFYSGLLYIAQQRGFKDGWVSHKYKERFGVWPAQLERVSKRPIKAVREYEAESRKKYLEQKKATAQPYAGNAYFAGEAR